MKEQELDLLMKQHSAQLLRIAYYYTKNLHTAEDIVQDVFIKFYHLKQPIDPTITERYLIKMTVNKAKDYLKSWHYQRLVFQEKWLSLKTSQQDALIVRDEEQLISDAVLSLPMKEREIVAYYYLEGLTLKAISELLQINENTLKSRLVKARKLLRVQLQEVEWEVLKDDTL
ncbi:sigma-70 family RNA polymerase sigma factor [Solibacillus daqui]|uniref:sigma-70 family RNA polymerase sigma factor n=1 Tax=Solibacillus daqui TaxID=2912187 RepID=UPI002366B011|nr:sigma-70 family RNA polymerase sigma factor [Solibacillus daqui]